MISMKRILIPTDFSERSNVALSYAVELAQALNGRLFLLHVPGTTGENFEADYPFGPFGAAAPLAAKKPMDADASKPLRLDYAVRIGSAADEIMRYAADREVDLIVMSTHGRSGVAHMVVGSVAEKVIRNAPCPVVIVPRPKPSAS